MAPKNPHIHPQHTARVSELRDVPAGTVFRLPGSRVKWVKMDRPAEKAGWLWLYWCTDGKHEKLHWGGKTIFIDKPAEEGKYGLKNK